MLIIEASISLDLVQNSLLIRPLHIEDSCNQDMQMIPPKFKCMDAAL